MVKFSVDTSSLERSLKDLSKKVNKSAEDSVIELAQASTRQLAIKTSPPGIAKKSQDILEKAIYKDINKVYQNVGVTYNQIKKINPKKATAYAYCMNNGQEANAEEIAESVLGVFDIGNVDNGGRLNANRGSNGRVGETASSPIGVSNRSEVEGLKEKKKFSAGLIKKGFLEAGKALGSRFRIPAWLRSKTSGLGDSSIVRAGWKTTVTIHNRVRYASSMISDGKIKDALRVGYNSQIKKLQKQLDALSKRV